MLFCIKEMDKMELLPVVIMLSLPLPSFILVLRSSQMVKMHKLNLILTLVRLN